MVAKGNYLKLESQQKDLEFNKLAFLCTVLYDKETTYCRVLNAGLSYFCLYAICEYITDKVTYVEVFQVYFEHVWVKQGMEDAFDELASAAQNVSVCLLWVVPACTKSDQKTPVV